MVSLVVVDLWDERVPREKREREEIGGAVETLVFPDLLESPARLRSRFLRLVMGVVSTGDLLMKAKMSISSLYLK
jgi:hypothetical protein